MEVIYTQLLAAGAKAPSVRKDCGSQQDADSFQSLMTQRAGEQTAAPKEAEEDAVLPGETAHPAPLLRQAWQQQMELAAALGQLPQTVPQTLTEPAEAAPEALPALWQSAADVPAQPPVGQLPLPEPEAARETVSFRALPGEMTPAAQETPLRTEESLPPVGTQADAAIPQDAETERSIQTLEFAAGDRPVFREVEHIPLQVGETEPAERAGTAAPAESQIAQALTRALETGQSRVSIQLQPRTLGRVEVELTWSREGALRVSIQADSSRTHSMLERSADGLRAILNRNAAQEVYVEVRRQEESQERPFYQGQDQPHQQSGQHPRQQSRRQEGEDFLQQLRLGLIPLEEAVG